MALAITANFTILDAKGKSSLTKIRFPTGFSLSQYLEAATALAQLAAKISNGVITEVSIGVPLSLSGATIRATALSIADVAEKALFIVRSSIAGLFARFSIPTYNEDNTVDGSDDVDQVDADIAAYISVVEDGVNVSGFTVFPQDLRGNNLDVVTEAREIFRRFG